MPFARAPQLFSASLWEGAVATSGGRREQSELAGCARSARLGSRGATPWTPKQGGGAQGTGTASN
eukprot:2311958-Alexandrium_andersonii.AAC.1